MKTWIKRVAAFVLSASVLVTTSFHASLQAATNAESETEKRYTFRTIEDVKENFVSYYAPKDKNVEDVDTEGNPVFSSCDATKTWNVSDGELIRYGEENYAGYQRRLGPAVLYTKEWYEDFTAEYDCRLDAFEGWGWIAFGFGASAYGKHYGNDNYLTAIEKEGTIQLFHKSVNGSRIQSDKINAFTTAREAKEWIHVQVSVINGMLKVSYTYTDTTTAEEKTVQAQKELTGYSGGYLYLLSSTQYMHFKNLKIAKHKVIKQVSDGQRILTAKNIPFAEVGLPDTLEAVCKDGTETKVNVVWKQGTYDASKDGMYKITGTVNVSDQYYKLDADISEVCCYVEVGDYDPKYTDSIHFLSDTELNKTFSCYYVSRDDELKADNLLKTDVTNCWTTDAQTYGIVRNGTGDYAAGSKANGASLLYFNGMYKDFEVEYEYCFTEVYSNWRQMGLGFGAPSLGNTHLNDSYLALIQQEGTAVINYAIQNVPQSARWMNKTNNATYQEQVKTNLKDYTGLWHTVKYTVSNGVVMVEFDGNGPYTQSVPGYESGYVYLYTATQGVKLRNIKITNLQSGVMDEKLLPTQYDVTNYTSGAVSDLQKGNTEFSFSTELNGASIPIKITFPMEQGVRIRSTHTGFFESDDVRSIDYQEEVGMITAVSGQDKVVFTYRSDGWVLDIYRGNEKKTSMSSEQIAFGYVDTEVKKIKFTFDAGENEKFYGLGERFNGVYQNGYAVSLWNEDVGYHTSASSDSQKYVNSYANVPILHSTENYTLFFNSTCAGTADICKTQKNQFYFDFNEDIFDIYIWTDTVTENIQQYASLTGLPYVPAKWAFRYWAGAGSRVWGNSASEESEVLSVLQDMISGYEDMGVANLAALYGEAPMTEYASAYQQLCAKGIQPLAWNRCSVPYATMRTLLSGTTTAYPTIALASDTSNFYGNQHYTYIDYSHSNATKLVKALYRDKIQLGLRGLMVDMGEKIGEDTVFANGKTGAEMHNLYSYYYAKAIHEVFEEQLGNDFVLFERSGSAGSAHYAATFSGDQRADWNGLNLQLRGLLSSAASGMPIYGGDIGGFYGIPSDENYMRWVQFAAFTPLMREHGVTEGAINPWDFGEEAQEVFKKYNAFRDVILDTVYSSALQAGTTGEPMTKTLSMYDATDSTLHGIEDEYMFCDAFLVAPVTAEGVTSRKVTLPQGVWYDLYHGKCVKGGTTIMAEATVDEIPVYIKAGAVLPVSVTDNYRLFEAGDRKTLLVTAPEQAGSNQIYLDEQNSCEYVFDHVTASGFVLEQKGGNQANSIMLHGYHADLVLVDGVRLNQNTTGVGYEFDGVHTIIRLDSETWSKIEIHGDSVTEYVSGSVQESRVHCPDLSSVSTLEDCMTSYAVLGSEKINAVDNNGDSCFRQTELDKLWKIEIPGILERSSNVEYQSTNVKSRNGAAALYFPECYEDFELKFQYSYSGIETGWRWVSVGVGAEKIGDTYYDSGYLAMIEQDGKVKIVGDAVNGVEKTYKVHDEALTGYGGEEGWHDATISVKDQLVTITFDKQSYSYSLKNYKGGYVYLHCFTEGMRFREISLTDYQDVYTSASKVNQDFTAYRFEETTDNPQGNPGFGATYTNCPVSDVFAVKNGSIMRVNGTNYQNRKLAHLFYKESLSDFCLSFRYRVPCTSWDTVQIGFGAEHIGDSVYRSGFLIEIDKDGKFYIKYKRADKEELITTPYTQAQSEQCSAKHKNGEMIPISVVFVEGELCVTIDGKSVIIDMSKFQTNGYVSFGAATSNIVFSQFMLTNANAYSEIAIAGQNMTSGLQYAKAGESVNVDVKVPEGYRIRKEGVTYRYLGENGMVTQRLSQKEDGTYLFTMPRYGVTMRTAFYQPYDANADNEIDICDMVKMNCYLSSEKYSIDEDAADVDDSGVIDEIDFYSMREKLLH